MVSSLRTTHPYLWLGVYFCGLYKFPTTFGQYRARERCAWIISIELISQNHSHLN